MPAINDGPCSPWFTPLLLRGGVNLSALGGASALDRVPKIGIPEIEDLCGAGALRSAMRSATPAMPPGLSRDMTEALGQAPDGTCVSWGIPFEIGEVVVLADRAVSIEIEPTQARWLVFLHTSDVQPLQPGPGGIISPMPGAGRLAEHAADYVICYADGSQVQSAIRRRYQVGSFQRVWGENCFEAVAHHKPRPTRAAHEQLQSNWGVSQTRAVNPDNDPWTNWLWAWQNPFPEKTITGLRFEPAAGIVIISAITAGNVTALPLRWQTRRKACLVLPEGEPFQPGLDSNGLLQQIQIDLGQVISAASRLVYPNDAWPESYNNQVPELAKHEVLIEYTAHPEACFYLNCASHRGRMPSAPTPDEHPAEGPYFLDGSAGKKILPVSEVEAAGPGCASRPYFGDHSLHTIPTAAHSVKLRVVERGSQRVVPVKLHIHGEWGEYLAPVDRHRILNPAWFEDYSVDFAHILNSNELGRTHASTYIRGETTLKLPLGRIYLEISKGFEIRPVRKWIDVTAETEEIVVEIEKVLPWREKGWVTADTHVHFLSPTSAMLEGAAEGVNVINLLASQWGELMTNVGDFDGQNTWGSKEAGGNGEYLVRVGTENRQHVLGHISLLGYRGPIIAPMTTGGPDESALGDPIETLLVEWARQCHSQGGLVVLPHFPNPRAEHAAGIVSGDIDAIEMTSWEDLYSGISPYSLSDWYRYLNCGYLVPAVGGTDKMAACTAVGTVRTYARVLPDQEFNYETWKETVRRGETFVTYGPLLEFQVAGQPMGSRISMSARGGTVDVTWQVASVTVPLSRVELVINGEIRESLAVPPSTGCEALLDQASGHWSVKIERSSWLALLVRGHYSDQPEIIAAHSSPVMIQLEGSPLLAAADAVTILDQIEGAMAYLDTVGTRAEDRVYKRMRLVLETAHRTLHNRMHQQGNYHEHTHPNEHAEHHCAPAPAFWGSRPDFGD